MKNKKVIYSAMIGGYDNIPFIKKVKGWDYVMFTDMSESEFPKNSNWEYRKANLGFGKTNTLVCRYYKTHPHEFFSKYEESIWIDANISIKSFDDIEKRIKKLKLKEIKVASCEHSERDCIYDEIEAVLFYKKDIKKNTNKIFNYLKKAKYPAHNGLFETNFLWRQHNDKKIIKLMNDWWFFIKNYTHRDQLSFNYILWKNKIKAVKFFGKGGSVRNQKCIDFEVSHKVICVKPKSQFKLKKYLIKLLCLFIPVKKWRRKLRAKKIT